MKKLLLIAVILLASCRGDEQERSTVSDIKYITRNHQDLSTYLKSEFIHNQIVHIVFPEYIEESYDLIKYVAFITKEFGEEGVYIPNLPTLKKELPLEENLLRLAPEFGHSGFVQLYNFLDSYNISFIKELVGDKKIVVLSGNSSQYKINRELLDKGFRDATFTISLAGTEDTYKLKKLINSVPLGKSVGVIPLDNWRFPVLNEKYDAIVFNGEISHYKEVVPLELYTLENHSSAPVNFLEENKGINESRTVDKLNRYLKKRIAIENKYFNFKEIDEK